MNYLEDYYSNYDEEGRLLSQHGQVEYLTTMKYIHELSEGISNCRILEVGAGTGRYSVSLARQGYSVDAVELTQHNLEIMRAKINAEDDIRTYQGTATDLSLFQAESFEMTLVFGPMYHLYTEEDKKKALSEAIRVTKTGGVVMVEYIMNDFVVIKDAFEKGNLKADLKSGLLDENFKYAAWEQELFAFETLDSIHDLIKDFPVKREKIVAADGAANYMRDLIDSFDEETFSLWMKFHLARCERAELIGATNHCLDILRKIG